MTDARTDGLEVLWENDDFIFARERDQLRAYTIMNMLASLAPSYGMETMFAFFERHNTAVQAQSYGILYEKAVDAVVSVPVAYVTWAHLSRACAVIFRDRLRPLRPDEFNSGKQLWAIDLVAPLGHGNETREAFEAVHVHDKEYYCTKLRNGNWRMEAMKNRKSRLNEE